MRFVQFLFFKHALAPLPYITDLIFEYPYVYPTNNNHIFFHLKFLDALHPIPQCDSQKQIFLHSTTIISP